MKKQFKISLFALTLLSTVGSFGYLGRASADESPRDESPRNDENGRRDERRRHHDNRFMLGVCVGQTLAQQGITLPVPTPGQSSTPDSTNQSAIQAAVQTCRAQLSGASPSPQPSPSESAVPAPIESGTSVSGS